MAETSQPDDVSPVNRNVCEDNENVNIEIDQENIESGNEPESEEHEVLDNPQNENDRTESDNVIESGLISQETANELTSNCSVEADESVPDSEVVKSSEEQVLSTKVLMSRRPMLLYKFEVPDSECQRILLLDSGASHSSIKKSLVKELNLPLKTTEFTHFLVAGNKELKTLGSVVLSFTICGIFFDNVPFIVLPDCMDESMILGDNFCNQFKLKVRPRRSCV